MTNCPNCGAVVTGYQCEYCETVFDISKSSECDQESYEIQELIHEHLELQATINDYNKSFSVGVGALEYIITIGIILTIVVPILLSL